MTPFGLLTILSLITIQCVSVKSELSCTFEKGFCSWTQSYSDHFVWNLHSGQTHDRTSGPISDHTSGAGNYAVIYGHDAHSPLSKAVLTSPQVFVFPNTTLSFYYHMNGQHIGHLSLISVDSYNSKTTLWTKQGRQGPTWIMARVPINEGTQFLMFEATAEDHYGSDIAIDDIRLNCEPFESQTLPPTTVPVTSTTSPSTADPNHIKLDCNFDLDMCSWSQDSNDDFDWYRWSGHTPDFTSGPYEDHTNGNGYYMLMKGQEARNSSWVARFSSPPVTFKQKTNMTFWYHMNGLGIGNLSVYMKSADGSEVKIWGMNGRQSSNWTSAQITLPAGHYRIIFEADTKFHYGSDLAVDDIQFDSLPIIG